MFKQHPSRIFVKFEIHEGSLKISFCLCFIRISPKFSGDSNYEPLSRFM